MPFDEIVQDIVRTLEARSQGVGARQAELGRGRAREQAARFGAGGTSLQGAATRAAADATSQARLSAALFGGQARLGEAQAESAFGRGAGLQRELQANQFGFQREQGDLNFQRAEAIANRLKPGFFETFFKTAAPIAGATLGNPGFFGRGQAPQRQGPGPNLDLSSFVGF